MKILVDDITESPKELVYTETVDALNTELGRGAHDFRMAEGIGVEVQYYRGGLDVFFRGSLHGEVVGTCARCLEDFRFRLDQPFSFVTIPRAAASKVSGALSADDTAQSYYDGSEIDLTPHIYEETMLALPLRALCRDDCRGLCARCGTNLNAGSCGCQPTAPPPHPTLGRGR